MNSKDFRTLQEAYLSVYEPQQLDEGIRSAVKRLLGGKKKEEKAPEPESRGAYLRRRYNVGPEKSDTSAKRQILDRSRARKDRDEEKYGGSVYTKKVAQQSADAHDRYLKAGYSKYGADLKHGKGNKAAKRAAALQREEVDFILSYLLDEGYVETQRAAEAIIESMSEEWIDSIIDEALTGDRYKKVMNKPGGTAYSRKVSADPSKRSSTLGGRGGESDFGAGDRGGGHKNMRRRGIRVPQRDD